MRADRLLAILMHLQTRGKTTTHRLAVAFEVSRRTILRDLYALRVAGFPVYTETGPGGGCYLHEEFRNTLTQLTTDEIAALFVSSSDQPLKDLGLSEPLRGALLKLSAAIPEARHGLRSRIAERLLIDATPWFKAKGPVDHLTALYEASMNDHWVLATFQRRFDIAITRRIATYGLVAKQGSWHVVWAGEEVRLRVDRLSAVRSVQPIAEGFDRPQAFSLEPFWRAWEAQRSAAMRPGFQVRLRVQRAALAFVQDALGERRGVFPRTAGTPEAWTDLDVAFSDFNSARSGILALGGAVEVLQPPALRASVADFAEQTSTRYQHASQQPRS